MSDLFLAIASTLMAALSVKQIADALMNSVMLVPFRTWIRKSASSKVPGSKTLNRLLTCRTSMCGCIAFWWVAIPAMWAGFRFDILGQYLSHREMLVVIPVLAFAYAMGVAALALGLWVLLEHPASRHNKLVEEFGVSRVRVNDLTRMLKHYADSKGKAEGEKRAPQISLSFFDFYRIVSEVNETCSKIKCGFKRRDCRKATVKGLLVMWASEHQSHSGELPFLEKRLEAVLPDYFREFSKRETGIGDFNAFMDAYQRVVSTAQTAVAA